MKPEVESDRARVFWPQFTPPRLALRKQEAAACLGVSDETFDARVKPFVRVVRWGRVRLYPVTELERFLEGQASAPVDVDD